MTFRVFTEYGAASRMVVTIRTNDLLFVSKSTIRQFNEDAIYARLLIDEINKRIGIEFLTPKPDDSNHRKLSWENAGATINIGPVLRFFGIKRLQKREKLSFEKEGNMLVFSVKELTEKPLVSS